MLSPAQPLKQFISFYCLPERKPLARGSIQLAASLYPIGLTLVDQVAVLFCQECQSLLTLDNCIPHLAEYEKAKKAKSDAFYAALSSSKVDDSDDDSDEELEIDEELAAKIDKFVEKYGDKLVPYSESDRQQVIRNPRDVEIYKESVEEIIFQIPLKKAVTEDKIISLFDDYFIIEPVRGLQYNTCLSCCGRYLRTEMACKEHKESCRNSASDEFETVAYQQLKVDGKFIKVLPCKILEPETLEETWLDRDED
ncbi:hypothetical protein SJAG_03645 [Schizosaccharomyces japonicus yFS275]|uniref:Uncharacterized protein n=1 Tax=Schizosaccharomyces japonicus (strain yFS275 / FY16936) TaxID=402676 RepID=B6K4T2_SCHJY|nr:hypothetical protein SJAG_03645 [Schizosaccharomyces japonicus yFS275]EEB08489.1 hypothetical protein SJAG_03645 [Schizosaccharomyces japonicus yFS275]